MRVLPLLIFCFCLLAGCRQPAPLRVAVAANAQYVARALLQEFGQRHGVKTELVVNSSGKIAAQVAQGAPYEVFLSADTQYPQALYAQGLTRGQPRVYGYGQLILWTTRPLNLHQNLGVLLAAHPGKIALANPATAPYGRAAMEALRYYGQEAAASGRLVLGESVGQVNQYILSGAVELGFTSLSVVYEPGNKGKGSWRPVDPRAYSPIAQSAVLLRPAGSGRAQQAQLFFDFLFSPAGQAIFKRYGYTPQPPNYEPSARHHQGH
ncbi:MAG: molybdate ABC transporter substrate-binding protein [Adhaeribacter sp.]